MRGISTKGFVDNQKFSKLPGIFFISTESYITVLGAKKTVLKLKAINVESVLKPHVKNELRKIKNSTNQKWIDDFALFVKESTRSPSKPSPERLAQSKLRLARQFLRIGNRASAKKRLMEIVKKFPNTKAAKSAKTLCYRESDSPHALGTSSGF